MTEVVPSTPEGVVAAVLDLVATRPGRVRLAVDGAPAVEAHELATRVTAAHGRAVHVRAEGFWRPAGQRFEHGREDPDAWLDDWLDDAALEREVLVRAAEAGAVVPALRDPVTDRSLRLEAVPVPEGGLVVVSGSALLGRWLSFDLAVHLRLSEQALLRRLPQEERWTVAAVRRYAEEQAPETLADLVVRAEDPRHPALQRRA